MTFQFNPDHDTADSIFRSLSRNLTDRVNETREQVLMDLCREILGQEDYEKMVNSIAFHDGRSHSRIFQDQLWKAGYQLEIVQTKELPNLAAMSKEIIRVYRVAKEVELTVGLSYNHGTAAVDIQVHTENKKG